jgi:peptidoglycan/xylan/chitin deacetylase (PgdA/CDA1 family)
VTLSLTFDNLGEAAELERGLWSADRPSGNHPSVTDGLPRVLDLLADDVRSTFFIEGWSATTYPDAVCGIARRGHEVAVHGWRHERWRTLGMDGERDLLARSRVAFADVGVSPVGFRPPGGQLARGGTRVLAELGFTYHSSAGGPAARGEVASLPFDWRLVDATWIDPVMAPVRRHLGMSDDPPGVSAWRGALMDAVDAGRGSGAWRALVFHPYLLLGDDAFDVLAELVALLREDEALQPITCREAAARLS